MQEQLQRRLDELKKEFEIGQGRLREIEQEKAFLHETLLRISGAIQVLEEIIQQGRQQGETEPVKPAEE